ncbi:oxidoreductase [Brachybacterium sp. P6-10-X1]|uniref:TIGR03364 family FAD-dependent oxidoreductase n=1 Tax=Brachybacterium sp. P6-10-X1 TaxID=1903186 RepID=UPI000971BC46|nr:TIGR03364 family FAD-dependent oxidoreductase [Brachybacterium sp. P6-10-X1]APX33163.1 oxidoreductase [Brachybacterium sp. P6-10-X1]
MSTECDLIVVGSGILGLATAHRALDQGLDVTVIEESARPVGSSIQNFGHACFTGQSDELQDLAMASRSGWLRAAAGSGLWAPTAGTVVPAATAAELRVLEEFAAHRGSEQVQMLTVAETRTALAHDELETVGGARLPLDMRVDPRTAVPDLAAHLEARGVRFRWNERVLHTADGVVGTTRGTHRAERVVVCPGTGVGGLVPAIADRHGITQCTLAMALIERPEPLPAHLAVLTGTSLARYDGFAAMPGTSALRAELAEREPELTACRANLMVTGIGGGLLVGDSHAYDDSPDPFLDAGLSELLLGRAAALLGIERPRVLQRWLGRYSDAPGTTLVIEHPDASTTVAVVTSGVGMTLGFGIAERVLENAPALAA